MQKQAHLLEILEVELLGGVVQVDRFVRRGEFGVGLERLAHAGEVAGEFVGEHLLVGGHVAVELFDLGGDRTLHAAQGGVDLRKMALLLLENRGRPRFSRAPARPFASHAACREGFGCAGSVNTCSPFAVRRFLYRVGADGKRRRVEKRIPVQWHMRARLRGDGVPFCTITTAAAAKRPRIMRAPFAPAPVGRCAICAATRRPAGACAQTRFAPPSPGKDVRPDRRRAFDGRGERDVSMTNKDNEVGRKRSTDHRRRRRCGLRLARRPRARYGMGTDTGTTASSRRAAPRRRRTMLPDVDPSKDSDAPEPFDSGRAFGRDAVRSAHRPAFRVRRMRLKRFWNGSMRAASNRGRIRKKPSWA